MTIALYPPPLELRRKPTAIEYPTSDGKPMAETDLHRDLMIDHILMFQARYENDPNVYVSGNNLIYYEEGDITKCISPDLYFVFGVKKKQRELYKVWEEGGHVPSIAFEFTSKSTRREDKGKKFEIYEQKLKTPELILFDPTGDYLKPALQGHRLENGKYVPIEMVNGRLYSEVLGLEIVAEGSNLRLYDPVKEEWLLTPREHRLRADSEANRANEEARHAYEEARRANEEARRADNEAQARAAAEAKARDEARRANDEAQARAAAEAKARDEARRANEEARRANAEAEAREASDAENARLRAQIEALQLERG